MKSEHLDEFNHDPWAEDYDIDVLDESNPIRTGYGALLDWVVLAARTGESIDILELGSGTGNLTQKLKPCNRLLCVDISEEMENIAIKKLEHIEGRDFHKSDILEIFDGDIGHFDSVVSTYTIHHLEDSEKEELFKRIWDVLRDGGNAVFGDLMFESEPMKRQLLEKYRKTGLNNLAEDIEEEFFWDIDSVCRTMREIGFRVEVSRFSELSFGIIAEKA